MDREPTLALELIQEKGLVHPRGLCSRQLGHGPSRDLAGGLQVLGLWAPLFPDSLGGHPVPLCWIPPEPAGPQCSVHQEAEARPQAPCSCSFFRAIDREDPEQDSVSGKVQLSSEMEQSLHAGGLVSGRGTSGWTTQEPVCSGKESVASRLDPDPALAPERAAPVSQSPDLGLVPIQTSSLGPAPCSGWVSRPLVGVCRTTRGHRRALLGG